MSPERYVGVYLLLTFYDGRNTYREGHRFQALTMLESVFAAYLKALTIS